MADGEMISFPFTQLPTEIQRLIVESVASKRSMQFPAILTSRTWFDWSIDILWRRKRPGTDCVNALLAMPYARRQFYANMIQYVTINNASSYNAFKDVQLKSIKDFSIRGSRSDLGGQTTFPMAPFIQKTLECLHFAGPVSLDAATIEQIMLHCPSFNPCAVARLLRSHESLRSLTFGHLADNRVTQQLFTLLESDTIDGLEELELYSLKHIDQEYFLGFLENCTSLRRLNIDEEEESTLNSQLLAHILDCSTLEEVEIGSWLTLELVNTSLSNTHTRPPFREVDCLVLRGEPQGVKMLLHNTSATAIWIETNIPDRSLTSCIGSFANLTLLDIAYRPSQELSREDIQPLYALINLVALTIRTSGTSADPSDLLQVMWMSDDDFGHWVSHYPQLENLTLEFGVVTLTADSIQHLGHSFPLLEAFSLLWKHDICDWRYFEGPLFPNVTWLELGDVKRLSPDSDGREEAIIKAKSLAEIFLKHIAKIEHFAILNRSYFASALVYMADHKHGKEDVEVWAAAWDNVRAEEQMQEMALRIRRWFGGREIV